MGGDSGGGWSSLGDVRALEEKAKAALQGGKRNVFISFATEDMDEVNLIRAHAKNEKNDIEFNDHSVKIPYDSDRAEYIKHKIGEKISRVSTTVVYLSKNAAQSKWVKWEVEKSKELGKRVIAVHSGDRFEGDNPAWCDNSVKVVSWRDLGRELSQ